LMARAEELSSSIKSHVDDAENSLTNLMLSTSETIQSSARSTQQSLLSVSADLTTQLKQASIEVEQLVGTVGSTAANAIRGSAEDAHASLLAVSSDATSQIKSLTADVERTLTSAGANTASVLLTSAREAQSTLTGASTDLVAQMQSLSTTIEQTLSGVGATTAAALLSGTRDAQATLMAASDDMERSLKEAGSNAADAVANSTRSAQMTLMTITDQVSGQVKALSADLEQSLSTVGTAAVGSVLSGAQEAQATLVAASSNAAEQVRSLSADVERMLSTVGSDTAAQILRSAREAQGALTGVTADTTEQMKALSSSLVATTSDTASQIRTLAETIEQTLTTTTASSVEAIQSGALAAQTSLVAAANEAGQKAKATAAEIEQAVLGASNSFQAVLSGKSDEIVGYMAQQTDRLSETLDSKRGSLVETIGGKSNQLIVDIERVTSEALKAIESRGLNFSQSIATNGSTVARSITAAGELATGAVNKSLKDLEQASRASIEQSRQVSMAAVTEMQETSKVLRTDTVALFERLREGNILLQEVLTGAHDNLNSLERAMVSRVAEFVAAITDVSTRSGNATQNLEDQLTMFHAKTSKAIEGLAGLSSQFEDHGRALVEAVTAMEQSNRNTDSSIAERKAALDSLVGTIDARTLDLDQRLTRFTALLDESLAAAEERARDIARVVADTAGTGSATITRQFEAVRTAAEEQRQATADTLHALYEKSTQETEAIFRQSADKFASMVQGMKQMASEMHQELEMTREELRRGVFELPQEAAENTAQMRKVIVDQIEALAELNRIVARHGRGADVVNAERTTTHRREEPQMAAAVGGYDEAPARPAPRRETGSAATLPPPDLGMPMPQRSETTPVSPNIGDAGDDRDGWLSDLLSRADTLNDDHDAPRSRPSQQPAASQGNPLETLSLDISRLMDRNLAAEMWDRYQRGENKAFSKRLYTPAGQKTFDEVARKYRSDRNFKQTVDRYITEFERLLDDVARDERGPAMLRSHLISETGLVYTMLAHASGRLN